VRSEGLSSLAIDAICLMVNWTKRGRRIFHSLPHFWHTEANGPTLATRSWGLPVLPYREPTLGEGPPGFMRPFAFGKLCCQWQRRRPHIFPLASRQCPSYSQSVHHTAGAPAISRHRPWVRESRKRRIAINFLPSVRHVSKQKSPGSLIVSHNGNRQPMCRELPVKD
jgi:hypothetical protein